MTTPVDVTALVGKVLDLAWYNHATIADNIARVGLPGEARTALDFDAALSRLSQAYHEGSSDMIRDFRAEDHVRHTAGDPIAIESEMVALTRNTLFYQGLLTARGQYTDILSMAISGESR